ncbi:MAG: holo-ACP synthase [Candidatus Tokpelaia sp.]|uniref:holo-ACP synthase n=1 Tax=Candidatus Tokpelaia sp. TaxID=2233777 RepID=UPI00123C2AC9|nr:holo-ACP synthase [Candidatus Tokpelaia sp.]KAA6206628.1 MAG: holo-ACP synthase [Candidatus Tokpelaia sp.]KAA6206921.1 MAG: holo-ACP synthase [Candidatus Tokpelaia sp.]KAA6405512.1 holo-ACP synthase [Candidatus Tokpelaia sp.]
MIIGIGNDIITIARVEKVLQRHGTRFTQRVFTAVERQKSEGRRQKAASYAKRFAAKEACAKALGTGIGRGVYWRNLGVVNLPSGAPTMEITGQALNVLASKLPPRHKAHVHVTLSDDEPFAQAFVLIEAVPL